MCRRLAREEGVFVGPSAGANVVAALRVARETRAVPGARSSRCSATAASGTSPRTSGRSHDRARPNVARANPPSTAAEAYPEECCGALLGATVDGDVRVTRRRAGPERVGRSSATPLLDRPRWTTAARAARRRESGLGLVGFYHSHPDHPAVPSEYDREHALPFFHYSDCGRRGGPPAGDDVAGSSPRIAGVVRREELCAVDGPEE